MKDKKYIIIEDTIKNILPNNDRSKLINCNGDDFFKKKNTNNERMNMKTFKYKWKNRSVWQQEKYKTDTIQAENISEAKKILDEKFYGFVKNPDCMFGGGHYKDSQEYSPDSLEETCNDCEGNGYYTDVTSSGLSDPKDPYHEPHIERCDTCEVFNNDVEAKEYHEKN